MDRSKEVYSQAATLAWAFHFEIQRRLQMKVRVHLLSGGHAGGQQGDDGEHVLQRVDHGHEGHDAHRQGVVIS